MVDCEPLIDRVGHKTEPWQGQFMGLFVSAAASAFEVEKRKLKQTASNRETLPESTVQKCTTRERSSGSSSRPASYLDGESFFLTAHLVAGNYKGPAILSRIGALSWLRTLPACTILGVGFLRHAFSLYE